MTQHQAIQAKPQSPRKGRPVTESGIRKAEEVLREALPYISDARGVFHTRDARDYLNNLGFQDGTSTSTVYRWSDPTNLIGYRRFRRYSPRVNVSTPPEKSFENRLTGAREVRGWRDTLSFYDPATGQPRKRGSGGSLKTWTERRFQKLGGEAVIIDTPPDLPKTKLEAKPKSNRVAYADRHSPDECSEEFFSGVAKIIRNDGTFRNADYLPPPTEEGYTRAHHTYYRRIKQFAVRVKPGVHRLNERGLTELKLRHPDVWERLSHQLRQGRPALEDELILDQALPKDYRTEDVSIGVNTEAVNDRPEPTPAMAEAPATPTDPDQDATEAYLRLFFSAIMALIEVSDRLVDANSSMARQSMWSFIAMAVIAFLALVGMGMLALG